jgi:hypothetical protein
MALNVNDKYPRRNKTINNSKGSFTAYRNCINYKLSIVIPCDYLRKKINVTIRK